MKTRKYYLYFIRCQNDKLYIGTTSNINKRLLKHKIGQGAKFTFQNKPKEIVYVEEFDNYLDAHRRELQVKKWRREKKENLIKFGRPIIK